MLELQNISYLVEGEKEILRDISLKVDDHLVVITGPNGSGKSTLAKVIAGLIQPTSGKILLNGEDITHLSVTERANKGISYAFQAPVRFKGLTVKDLMTLAAGKEASFAELCDMLSDVGLCAKEYINRSLDDSLSGGELKRIEIAMVFARATNLSIFDEPEAGIDLWSFQKLIHIFEKLVNETKGNIMIISHQERILDIADKIIYLKNGQVARYDTKENVLPDIMDSTEGKSCRKISGKMEEDCINE